jgi:RNA polymerase sigma-70 factor (ECF subfamily)
VDSHSIAEDMPSLRPSPERLYESKEISEAVREALQQIPEKLRAAIVLREIDGLSYEEIAEILDISAGTVKSRISRAREELRRLLHDKF